MRWPSPTDPADAPVWDNYVVAQATQAALRLVPTHAIALGVAVDGYEVTVTCRLTGESEQDLEDLADIADGLSVLLGDKARVAIKREAGASPDLSPHDGVRWFWAAR